MELFTTLVERASSFLWDYLLLFLLVGTGIFFTIRLRGVQLRRFGEGFHRVFGGFTLHGKKAGEDGMSSFQAVTTAIAGQVGTGNLAGAATAIVLGIGRAIGEAMAVMMVAGNSPNMPDSLFRSVTFLTTAIAKEMSYASGLQKQALFSIALVLFVFIMGINILLNVVLKGGKRDE